MAIGDRPPADAQQPLGRGVAARAEAASATGGEDDDVRREAQPGRLPTGSQAHASRRPSTSSSTSARVRAPWSTAMKWLPMNSEKAIVQRTSTSSSSGQNAPNSERM